MILERTRSDHGAACNKESTGHVLGHRREKEFQIHSLLNKVLVRYPKTYV
jgi:hypothetical protein